jgi:hypothetical protein
MDIGKFFVLAVSLLTWGGVFAYLIRLDKLAKRLEDELRAQEIMAEDLAEKNSTTEGGADALPPLALP